MYALVGWVCLGLPAVAFTATPEDAPQAIFIKAHRVIVRPGEAIDDAFVLVRAGKIIAVGKDLQKPEGAREIEGQVVCAGFIDPWGALGLGSDALGDVGTTAATRSVDAYDNYAGDHLRREALRAGVTCVRLQAGAFAPIGGLGVIVRLAPGLKREEAVVLADCDVSMSIGLSATGGGQTVDPFERLAQIDGVISAIEGGKSYLLGKTEHRYELEEWQKKSTEKEAELEKDAKKAKKDREKEQKDAQEKGKPFQEKKYKEDKRPQPPRFDENNEAFARVANGEVPLVVQANRSGEIRGLLSGAGAQDRLRLILAGGTEALGCAKQLAERHIPVLVEPALRGRGGPDEYESADLALAGDLSRAGVTVLIGSGGSNPGASRDLPLLAALCVGNGLDREKAFEALTLGAARAFDVADRLGSVERGKDADILVLDGEPLVTTTRVRFAISGGRVVLEPEE